MHEQYILQPTKNSPGTGYSSSQRQRMAEWSGNTGAAGSMEWCTNQSMLILMFIIICAPLLFYTEKKPRKKVVSTKAKKVAAEKKTKKKKGLFYNKYLNKELPDYKETYWRMWFSW